MTPLRWMLAIALAAITAAGIIFYCVRDTTCVSSKLSPASGDVVSGSYIVTLQHAAASTDVAAVAADLAKRYDVTITSVYDQLGMFAVHADGACACRLARDPRVLDVSPDRQVSID